MTKATNQFHVLRALTALSESFLTPGAVILAAVHAIAAAWLFAHLMVPGSSVLVPLTDAQRALIGAVCGGLGVPLTGAFLNVLGPVRWSTRSTVRWLLAALLLPSVLFCVSKSGSEVLHWRYAGKLIPVGLIIATICAIHEGRRHVRLLVRQGGNSAIVVGSLVYLSGDVAIWLATPEIHVKSTAPTSVVLNMGIAVMLCVLMIAIIGSRRGGLSAFVAAGLLWYGAMFAKILWMHAPLVPLDIQYAREFLLVAPDILGWPAIAVILLALVATVFIVLRLRRSDYRPRVRTRLLTGSTAVLAILLLCWFGPRFRTGTEGWSPLWQWCLDGSGVTFLADLRKSLHPLVPPHGYSREVAEAITAEFHTEGKSSLLVNTSRPSNPNLVFILVESLIDLRDIGVDAEPDPQPFLHSCRDEYGHRWAIVPDTCGGSSTTEFELLTGMEARMWPARTVPYYSLKWGDYHSIPRQLRQEGYSTTIFQVDSPTMYNRPAAYAFLHIGDVRWLSEEPLPAWVTPRPDGLAELFRLELDEVLFEAIAKQLETAIQPVFLFGFNGGTHAPYDADPEKWKLEFSGEADARELAGYCVEVRELDHMLEKLWQRIRTASPHTILVIVGDHMPPLKSRVGPYGSSDMDAFRLRRVPVLILGGETAALPEVISTNMLPWFVLEQMGRTPGSIAETLGRSAMRQHPVLSGNQPDENHESASRYRIHQFGHLNGELRIDLPRQ